MEQMAAPLTWPDRILSNRCFASIVGSTRKANNRWRPPPICCCHTWHGYCGGLGQVELQVSGVLTKRKPSAAPMNRGLVVSSGFRMTGVLVKRLWGSTSTERWISLGPCFTHSPPPPFLSCDITLGPHGPLETQSCHIHPHKGPFSSTYFPSLFPLMGWTVHTAPPPHFIYLFWWWGGSSSPSACLLLSLLARGELSHALVCDLEQHPFQALVWAKCSSPRLGFKASRSDASRSVRA